MRCVGPPTSARSGARSVGCAGLTFVVAMLGSGVVRAQNVELALEQRPAVQRVVVLADKNTRPFQLAWKSIQKKAVTAERVDLSGAAARLKRSTSPGEIFVALGPKTASMLAKSSKRGAAALVRQSEAPIAIPSVSVEVPLAEQLPWIKTAFPGRTRVIVLRSKNGPKVDALKAAFPNLRLSIVDVSAPENAVFALNRALEVDRNRSLVWLLPDAGVISANTIGPLSQAALSARVPTVGFSPYFLRVGALAAVESNYGEMALAAFDAAANAPLRNQLDDRASLKVKKYQAASPPGAHLVVNAKLAARLGIAVREGKGVKFQ